MGCIHTRIYSGLAGPAEGKYVVVPEFAGAGTLYAGLGASDTYGVTAPVLARLSGGLGLFMCSFRIARAEN